MEKELDFVPERVSLDTSRGLTRAPAYTDFLYVVAAIIRATNEIRLSGVMNLEIKCSQ